MTTDTEAIVDGLGADPTAPVGAYAGWTLEDLGRHVGQIHRWVTDVVTRRATERPSGGYPDAPRDGVGPWVADGAAALVDALREVAPDEDVWTFGPGPGEMAFWHRRMVLETALHRWDVDDALGRPVAVDAEVAVAGVRESLEVYLAPRLAGRELGAGEQVVLVPDDGPAWTITLGADGLVAREGRSGDADAELSGTALDCWLLLCCRRDVDALTVEGDGAAARGLRAAADLVPGPAG